MSSTKKNTSLCGASAFVDYKPAELRINSQFLIVYYAKNPITGLLERHRLTVPKIASKTERKKLGLKMVFEINKKLALGWLPYYNSTDANEFHTFEFCANKFIDHVKMDVDKKEKRPDTLRSYNSFLTMLERYKIEKNKPQKLIYEFNRAFVVNFLDWVFYDRQNSAKTFNNYLGFFNTFLQFCLERGYIKENFIPSIAKKQVQAKKRQVLSPQIKDFVKEIKSINPSYFALCMGTYFCFLRRTELTKIKVSDINLNDSFITVQGENAKNKKTENVTIPNAYLEILKNHISGSPGDWFVFSADNFRPGAKQLKPKKISDQWQIFRKQFKFSEIYQFYSLKDTGITDLLNTGIPAIKVRDQARHHDLKITEGYTGRNKTSDQAVRDSNFIF